MTTLKLSRLTALYLSLKLWICGFKIIIQQIIFQYKILELNIFYIIEKE
jgi:hypothetical protein